MTATSLPTLNALAADLAAGRTTSRALTETALARIADPAGEGKRAFLEVHTKSALATAEAMDRLRGAGIVLSPIMGLPISLKDLFDEAGHVTRAGSKVFADAPPAKKDSVVTARLRRAGAVIVGRTNLTEFAYSGLGINPHYGTPLNPWDRATGRIPGGSSAGAAVSVADGMAVAAIGTDTGGSVRIPSAFCGLTGFKPTVGRVPLDGVFPLSATLDSIGPLAVSVACCALLDGIMAGTDAPVPRALPIEGLRFAVPKSVVFDRADDAVTAAFAAALTRLSAAGARIVEIPLKEFEAAQTLLPYGGILGAEAYAFHRGILAEKGDVYDPRVRVRIARGENLSAADLIDLRTLREDLMRRTSATTSQYDAVLMPSVAIVAPVLKDLIASDDLYGDINPLVLRNTTLGNTLARCALSIPCHASGEAPVGLMVMGETGGDRKILQVGQAVEGVLRTA